MTNDSKKNSIRGKLGQINFFESKAIENKQLMTSQLLSSLMVNSYKKCTTHCFTKSSFQDFNLSQKDKNCLNNCYNTNFAV